MQKPKSRKSSIAELNNTPSVNWYQRVIRNARFVRMYHQPQTCQVCQKSPVTQIIVVASRLFGLCYSCGNEIFEQYTKDHDI